MLIQSVLYKFENGGSGRRLSKFQERGDYLYGVTSGPDCSGVFGAIPEEADPTWGGELWSNGEGSQVDDRKDDGEDRQGG